MDFDVKSRKQGAFLLGYWKECALYAHQEGCKTLPDPHACWGMPSARDLFTNALVDFTSLLVELSSRFPTQVHPFIGSAEISRNRLDKEWCEWHGSSAHRKLLDRVLEDDLPYETEEFEREGRLPYPRLLGELLFQYSPPEITQDLNSLKQLAISVAERLDPEGRKLYTCGSALRDAEVSILPATGEATDKWREEEVQGVAGQCERLVFGIPVPALSKQTFRRQKGAGRTDHSKYYLWLSGQLQALYKNVAHELGNLVAEPAVEGDAPSAEVRDDPTVETGDADTILRENEALKIVGGIRQLKFLAEKRRSAGDIEVAEANGDPVRFRFRKQLHIYLCFLADHMKSVVVEPGKAIEENRGFVGRSEIVKHLSEFGGYAGNIEDQISKFMTEINSQVCGSGNEDGISTDLVSSGEVPLPSEPTALSEEPAGTEPAYRLNVLPRFIADIPELK